MFDMHLTVKRRICMCYTVYEFYKHIIESYVSDYYVENHWSKLPKSWQKYLYNISVDHVAELLNFEKPVTKGVLPLSLLCVRNIIINVVIPRNISTNSYCAFKNEQFLKYFWKNVKLKKRHEIEKIAPICYDAGMKTNCFYIVDIGSGLGHLSRMLSYGYGFKVCTFEANSVLSTLATELDRKFEKDLMSKSLNHKSTSQTIHINKRVEENLDWKTFLKMVTEAFSESCESFRFGIVGLHPCGNLGSTLLRLYNSCPNIVFINMASCCYMKLTLEPGSNGFPLSNYCKNNNFHLTYLACEIACHAIENYVEKLQTHDDYYKLKIHAYRARLEEILVSIDSNLRHSAVCNVKYNEDLSFEKYCNKIVSKLSVVPPNKLVSSSEELINETWKNVVVFYSIRLLFAPLIETIILFDRLLYTEDFDSDCEIMPLFDSIISPRNHVLSARKRNVI
ncbi:protein RRNAD1 [Anoplophora glabripennis]|uniref:protein RRNAD1 n=1 Tax=Anoplophora glabripennis TaxID=217634 RepID=UPI00087530B0|nr:protein RRNAD1 [Anoplophora glabripennis]